MKAIIGGKRYDTETAEQIAQGGNSYPMSDFKCTIETLYRTKRGAWFLVGEGGGMSKYRRRVGGMWGWGEELRPLSTDEVVEWLEAEGECDILERDFPNAVQDA